MAEQDITVKIKPVTGDMFSVAFRTTGTILELKEEICKTYAASPEQIRLIYKGQILKDANTVDSYGIGNDHVVHLVKSKPPAGSAPTPTGGITTQQLTNMHRTSDPMVKHFESMGMSVDAAEQQAAGMRDMMSSPEWQAQFEALTNNPDAMRAMIEADPRAREMLRQVPEMRAVFNDPQELQRMARVMANPALAREMYRSLDLQISNAEAQGYSAQLASASSQANRIIERVADEAAEEADRRRREASQAQANNPFASLFGGGSGGGGAGTEAPAPPMDAPLPWAAPPAGAAPVAGAGAGAFGGFDPSLMANMFGGGAGGGSGGFPGAMPGGMPTRETRQAITAMLQTPAGRQMWQNQLRTLMPAVLAANPQAAQQFAALGFGDIATNPETVNRFVELVSNPQLMGLVDQLENLGGAGGGADSAAALQMFGQGGGLGGLGAGALGAQPGAPGVPSMDQLSASLGGLLGPQGDAGLGAGGAAGFGGLPPPPADPATAYASQLQQLNDMGFWDREANIRVLVATRGNVNAAVERLLSSPP